MEDLIRPILKVEKSLPVTAKQGFAVILKASQWRFCCGEKEDRGLNEPVMGRDALRMRGLRRSYHMRDTEEVAVRYLRRDSWRGK